MATVSPDPLDKKVEMTNYEKVGNFPQFYLYHILMV